MNDQEKNQINCVKIFVDNILIDADELRIMRYLKSRVIDWIRYLRETLNEIEKDDYKDKIHDFIKILNSINDGTAKSLYEWCAIIKKGTFENNKLNDLWKYEDYTNISKICVHGFSAGARSYRMNYI